MKVLMLGWELPPNISGGLGTACFGITRGLHELGDVAVKFVIPREADGEDQRFVELVALGSMDVPKPASFTGSYHGNHLFEQVRHYEKQITSLLRKDSHWDVIHAHDWLTVPAALRLKRLTGKPLVLHVHSTEYDRAGSHANPVILDIEKQGMDAADVIVAVSRFTRDILVDRYEQDPCKVSVIYNAICGEWKSACPPRTRTGATTISFLGRVTYQKGPRYFIEAARLALDANPDLQFVMAGDGDLLPEMKAFANANGMSESIYFPGFLHEDEVRHLLRHTDIYVMPSVSEPFGISALEAIHAGTAAILSKQSGVIELLNSAITVDYWDTRAIADAMIELASDRQHAADMAKTVSRELQSISWRNAAMNLANLYEKVARISGKEMLAANF